MITRQVEGRTFGTLYSGVGGADLGFRYAGWKALWQAESDPFRLSVLRSNWKDQTQYADIASAIGAQTPNLVYAELPTLDLAHWWPPLWKVARQINPYWLLIEFSPSVACDPILRDLILGGRSTRLITVVYTIETDDLQRDDWDVRSRALVASSRDLDASLPGGVSMGITIPLEKSGLPQDTLEFLENTRLLPPLWTCACDVQPCVCDIRHRYEAIRDATSPILTRWVASWIDGTDAAWDIPMVKVTADRFPSRDGLGRKGG